MASPLPASMYSRPDNSMRPPGMPMVIPIGILVLVVALVFGFSYYGSDEWWVGALVTMIGAVIVALMFLINDWQDRIHHRRPLALRFDKRLFLLGTVVTTGGMIVLLFAGGTLSGFVSTVAVLMGLALLVGGIFMFVLSLRA